MTSSPGRGTQARDYACRWGLSNEGHQTATIIPRRPGDTPEHRPGEGPSPQLQLVFIPDRSRARVRSPTPTSLLGILMWAAAVQGGRERLVPVHASSASGANRSRRARSPCTRLRAPDRPLRTRHLQRRSRRNSGIGSHGRSAIGSCYPWLVPIRRRPRKRGSRAAVGETWWRSADRLSDDRGSGRPSSSRRSIPLAMRCVTQGRTRSRTCHLLPRANPTEAGSVRVAPRELSPSRQPARPCLSNATRTDAVAIELRHRRGSFEQHSCTLAHPSRLSPTQVPRRSEPRGGGAPLVRRVDRSDHDRRQAGSGAAETVGWRACRRNGGGPRPRGPDKGPTLICHRGGVPSSPISGARACARENAEVGVVRALDQAAP